LSNGTGGQSDPLLLQRRVSNETKGDRRTTMRILLVDDEPALRELLRATLEGADVSVDEAASGLEAEARIRRRRPDVVVLDLRMPEMDGAELCRRLKADPRTSEIPIVLLTGADGEEARDAQRAGAAALVRKPFSPLDLLAVVQRVAGMTPLESRPPRRAKNNNAEEELVLYARDLRHLLEIERSQRDLLQQSYLATVTSLAGALESRDTRTGAHSQRVQRYAVELLDIVDPGRLERDPGVQYGFLLHDIGKMAIPDRILQKPGPLTRTERKHMQGHTILGEQMLLGVAMLQGEGLQVVRSHHERWDGRGYPDGIARGEITLAARVFAVADALDAMTSDRPYRRAGSWSTARDEILAQSGKHFDPEVVAAFRDREPALKEARRELAAA
jgi:cyclic di-GMP phosphodiesterase